MSNPVEFSIALRNSGVKGIDEAQRLIQTLNVTRISTAPESAKKSMADFIAEIKSNIPAQLIENYFGGSAFDQPYISETTEKFNNTQISHQVEHLISNEIVSSLFDSEFSPNLTKREFIIYINKIADACDLEASILFSCILKDLSFLLDEKFKESTPTPGEAGKKDNFQSQATSLAPSAGSHPEKSAPISAVFEAASLSRAIMAEALRSARKELGMSRRDAAKATGKNLSLISRVEDQQACAEKSAEVLEALGFEIKIQVIPKP